MQILSLELTNVKSYEHARYTFTPGVNAIVGPNGAGKSTIIEAIGYALFDALPYTVTEFVREGARTGSVAVTFLSDYDERPYRVERRFGGTNSYVVYDEEFQAKVCDGKADVLSFIRQHARDRCHRWTWRASSTTRWVWRRARSRQPSPRRRPGASQSSTRCSRWTTTPRRSTACASPTGNCATGSPRRSASLPCWRRGWSNCRRWKRPCASGRRNWPTPTNGWLP